MFVSVLKYSNVLYSYILYLQTKYDLVLCAYSLFELPDIKTRLELLLNLWNKCDDYLVIVERGTKAGFTLINEAREFLIDQCKKDNSGHVFSPVNKKYVVTKFLILTQIFVAIYYNYINYSVHMKQVVHVLLKLVKVTSHAILSRDAIGYHWETLKNMEK